MSERIRLVTAESDLEPAVADELVPRPEILRGEALEARVAQAVEAVEFQPTPEVYEAIHGFYADHYQLAGFLSDSLLGQNPAVPAEFDPNTPHVIQQTILKLAETKQAFDQQPGDQEQQRQFLNEAIKAAQQLFAESSLGVTTIGEAELAVRRQLGDQILDFSRRQQLLHLLDSPEMTSYGQAHASGFVETHYRFTGFGPHDLSKDEINRRISEEPAVADRDGSNVFQAGVEGHAWGQFQLDPAFERGVEKATDSFWGDVRHASRLEFHGSRTRWKKLSPAAA